MFNFCEVYFLFVRTYWRNIVLISYFPSYLNIVIEIITYFYLIIYLLNFGRQADYTVCCLPHFRILFAP